MSTMHRKVITDESHPKKLPQTIKFYNETKFGVDIMDQMARYHTCKTGTRRWPVACFFNMLDLCAINSWILYKEIIDNSISRRNFMLKLIEQLCLQEVSKIKNATKDVPQNSVKLDKKRHQCGKHTGAKVQTLYCEKCAN